MDFGTDRNHRRQSPRGSNSECVIVDIIYRAGLSDQDDRSVVSARWVTFTESQTEAASSGDRADLLSVHVPSLEKSKASTSGRSVARMPSS